MKERPILFSGPMVRAILEGRKTQTRRVLKMPPGFDFTGCEGDDRGDPANWGAEDENGRWWALADGDAVDLVLPCRYGQPGDRLWVRETWGPRADGFVYRATEECSDPMAVPNDGRWRPSIHMPRWARRLVLEITDVRVERLQAISDADIYAEGAITEEWLEWREDVASIGKPEGSTTERERDVWQRLWSSINGQASWDANPWVWVVSFRRIEA